MGLEASKGYGLDGLIQAKWIPQYLGRRLWLCTHTADAGLIGALVLLYTNAFSDLLAVDTAHSMYI